jgi:hypothetical protein
MRWYSAESAESLVVRTRQMAGNLMDRGLPNLLLVMPPGTASSAEL